MYVAMFQGVLIATLEEQFLGYILTLYHSIIWQQLAFHLS